MLKKTLMILALVLAPFSAPFLGNPSVVYAADDEPTPGGLSCIDRAVRDYNNGMRLCRIQTGEARNSCERSVEVRYVRAVMSCMLEPNLPLTPFSL